MNRLSCSLTWPPGPQAPGQARSGHRPCGDSAGSEGRALRLPHWQNAPAAPGRAPRHTPGPGPSLTGSPERRLCSSSESVSAEPTAGRGHSVASELESARVDSDSESARPSTQAATRRRSCRDTHASTMQGSGSEPSGAHRYARPPLTPHAGFAFEIVRTHWRH